MKVLISICIATITIIVLGVFVNLYLARSSKIVEAGVDKLESSTREKDWEAAAQELKEVNTAWNKVKWTWSILIDHIEIDNIDSALARLEAYIESKDYSMVTSEISSLKLFIDHIPQKESFNFKNIF